MLYTLLVILIFSIFSYIYIYIYVIYTIYCSTYVCMCVCRKEWWETWENGKLLQNVEDNIGYLGQIEFLIQNDREKHGNLLQNVGDNYKDKGD